MKTQDELKELKEKYEVLTIKLKELDENELREVIGGTVNSKCSILQSYAHTVCYLSDSVRNTLESIYTCSNCPKNPNK